MLLSGSGKKEPCIWYMPPKKRHTVPDRMVSLVSSRGSLVPSVQPPRAVTYVGGFSRFLVTPEKQVSYDGSVSVSVGGREGIKTCTIHAWRGWLWFLFLSDNTHMFAIREDDTCFSGLCGRLGVD